MITSGILVFSENSCIFNDTNQLLFVLLVTCYLKINGLNNIAILIVKVYKYIMALIITLNRRVFNYIKNKRIPRLLSRDLTKSTIDKLRFLILKIPEELKEVLKKFLFSN